MKSKILRKILIVTGGLGCSFTLSAGFAETDSPRSVTETEDPGTVLVENRLLTGTVTIDAGRHVLPAFTPAAGLGNLAISGGGQADTEATRIEIHQGGFAQFSNGLLLTSGSDFIFDGANQTHNLQVGYNGPAGQYSIQNFKLPAASQYTDASKQVRNELGGSWQIEAEYGNVFGDKQTFSSPTADAASVVWVGRRSPVQSIYYHPSTSMTGRDLVETGQPAARANVTASLTNWELARGAGVLSNERVNPLVTAEAIPGSQLDLSGVEVSITGTAVEDRQISGGMVDLGRVMIGSDALAINRTDTVTLWTAGSDDTRTRIHLGAFDLQNEEAGISAKHAAGLDFTNGDATSPVEISGVFTRTADTLGTHTKAVNAGANISTLENGGAGLAGENTQNELNLGYRWNVLENNNLVSDDLVIFESAGAKGTRGYSNGSVWHEFGTDTHTNVGFDASVEVNGTFSQGQHHLGTTALNAANGRIAGEGLDGENVIASTTFQTTLVAIERAEQSITASKAGPLTTGDTITIKDEGSGIYQSRTQIVDLALNGGDKLDYNLSLEGNSTIGHGQQSVVTIQYTGETITPVAGELGQVKRASFDLTLGESLDMAPFSALTVGRYVTLYLDHSSSSHSFNLETRFDAPASATGSATVAQGANFRENGLSLTNTEENKSSRFSTATQFELIDSQTLTDGATVNVSFTSVDDLDPIRLGALENEAVNQASRAGVFGFEASAPVAFSSDIVSLDGLDGLFQVVQLTVNETMTGVHQVVWETSYTDTEEVAQTAWVNAVLGNSNITSLDLLNGTLLIGESEWLIGDYLEENQFFGSYASYLRSVEQAQLGAWGYDVDGKRAWAVIDHNSDFATVIPEPGTYALLFGLAGFGYILVRRRRAAC